MPRFKVDDNCDEGCSQGLHVGSITYVKSYGSPGDKVIICKIDPADVVSIPLDSDHQKMRCCKYEVVAEYAEDLLPAVVDYGGYEESWTRNYEKYCAGEYSHQSEQDYEDSWNDE